MLFPLFDRSLADILPCCLVCGIALGTLVWQWSVRLTLLDFETVPHHAWTKIPILGSVWSLVLRRERPGAALGRLATELLLGALYVLLAWMMVAEQCQQTPDVVPSDLGRGLRVVFHAALITLLLAATVADLRDYVIPDPIVIVGIAIALGGHLLSGELQIQHIWIDWNAEVEGIKGPDFPAWIDSYRRLHGLSVAFAGMAAGAGLTYFVRLVSSWLLGQEAMGLGDVTLMAMIGAFIGWQPVMFVFLIAPLCGVILSLAQRFLGGKSYLPFGPFLAAATVVVLCTWKWLWMPMRYIFGHWPTLLGLMGGSAVAFVILLTLARLYRMIPVTGEHRYTTTVPTEMTQSPETTTDHTTESSAVADERSEDSE